MRIVDWHSKSAPDQNAPIISWMKVPVHLSELDNPSEVISVCSTDALSVPQLLASSGLFSGIPALLFFSAAF